MVIGTLQACYKVPTTLPLEFQTKVLLNVTNFRHVFQSHIAFIS